MALIRHILRFWLVLVFAGAGAYVLLFNQERIYVNLPGLGEFRVVAAVAFIACFLLGASAVTLHFIFDVLKKSFEISKLKKRNRLLESDLERQPMRDRNIKTSEQERLETSET